MIVSYYDHANMSVHYVGNEHMHSPFQLHGSFGCGRSCDAVGIPNPICYADGVNESVKVAADAVNGAKSYYPDLVTEGGHVSACYRDSIQLSDSPRLSFGLLFLCVGLQGPHPAHLPFQVRVGH